MPRLSVADYRRVLAALREVGDVEGPMPFSEPVLDGGTALDFARRGPKALENIFEKLGVDTRTAAVAAVREDRQP